MVVGRPRTSRATRPSIAQSAVATGRGDDGTTGLLFGGRVDKDDPRTEAYGTIDEAVAALGLARAEALEHVRGPGPSDEMSDLAEVILALQRGLFVAGAELASNPDAWPRLVDGVTRVDERMLDEVEQILVDHESRMTMPREFVVPGESRLSAALEVARTVLRRAERRAVGLSRGGRVAGDRLVPYINRQADLLWVLARVAEQAEQRRSTLARHPARAPRRRAPAGTTRDAAGNDPAG